MTHRICTTFVSALALFSAIWLVGCGGSGDNNPSTTGATAGGGGTMGTGQADLTFGLPVGTNADTSAISFTSVSGRESTSAIGTQLVVNSVGALTIPNRSLLLTVIGPAPAVGTTYVIGGSNPNMLVYTEVVSTTVSHSWGATGGQVRVTAVDGDKVTVAIEAAFDAATDTGATGTFNLSGTVAIDDVNP